MKKAFLLSLVLILPFACQKSVYPTGDVVARVGRSTLTVEDAKKQLFKTPASEADLESVVIRWVDDELLYQAALKERYDKDENLKAALKDYRRRLIGQAYLNGLIQKRVVVTPAEIRAYFQQHQQSFRRTNNEELVLHFLVPSKSEALKILSTLKKGETNKAYPALLETYGIQPVMVTENHLINELNSALFVKKSKRTLVGPIKTRSGYHVLKVIEKFPRGSTKRLVDVYDEIQQRLVQTKSSLLAGSILDSLRHEFHSEIKLEGPRAN